MNTGQQAEKLACKFLQQKGLKHREFNYRCKQGEIDIIMLDSNQLVFVEVRYRKNQNFGSAADTIDNRKQRKLILAANHYLSANKHHHLACRFDVISINGALHIDNIDWIQNAFEA